MFVPNRSGEFQSAAVLLLCPAFPPRGATGSRGWGPGTSLSCVGTMVGRGVWALEAQRAGSGRLCESTALDNHHRQRGGLAAERPQPAGVQLRSSRPLFTGGPGGGSVCYRPRVPTLSPRYRCLHEKGRRGLAPLHANTEEDSNDLSYWVITQLYPCICACWVRIIDWQNNFYICNFMMQKLNNKCFCF